MDTETISSIILVGCFLMAVYSLVTMPERMAHKNKTENRSSHDYNDKAEESGQQGESNVQDALNHLPKVYRVLHNINVRLAGGRHQEFDSIVIGSNGVFHLETKNYSGFTGGHITIYKDGAWEIRKPSGRIEMAEDTKTQVGRHDNIIHEFFAERMPGKDIPVHKAIVLSNKKIGLTIEDDTLKVPIIKIGDLGDYILQHQSSTELNPETISQIYQLLDELPKIQKNLNRIIHAPKVFCLPFYGSGKHFGKRFGTI